MRAFAKLRACQMLTQVQSVCRALLKQMLGEELQLDDLRDVDAPLHARLTALLCKPVAEQCAGGVLTFVAPRQSSDNTGVVELKAGGATTAVCCFGYVPRWWLAHACMHAAAKEKGHTAKSVASYMQVTDANKGEYVRLLAQFTLTGGAAPQVREFCRGLWACCPVDALRVFTTEHLDILLSRIPVQNTVTRLRQVCNDGQPVEGFFSGTQARAALA